MKLPDVIDTASTWKELLRHLADEPVIALDAEMDSYYSYTTKLCLIQIGSSAGDFLVDPFAKLDFEAFQSISTSQEQVKIFHAGENDIPYFRDRCGWTFKNVFDTHLAARVLGLEGHSLAKLLWNYFEVELDKSHQRADWRVRPLPPELQEYARTDTKYLIPLREILDELLQESDRREEARSAFEQICHARLMEKEFDPDGWAKMKGARELKPERRGVLRALYIWRDAKAAELDEAVFRMGPDPFMVALARKCPRNLEDLKKWAKHPVAKRYAAEIFEVIQEGRKDRSVPLPAKKKGKDSLSPRQQRIYRRLKAWRNDEAENRGVERDRVATNRLLKEVAAAEPRNSEELGKVKGMEPWRAADYGDVILKLAGPRA